MFLFRPVGKRIMETCRAFVRDKAGMLPVVFAVAIVPTLALMGTAIDFAGARHARASLQSAADAAVLEAVMSAEKLETAAGKTNDFKRNDVAYAPIKAGRDLFDYLAGETKSIGDVTFALEVERKGPKFTARGQYTFEYKNKMPNMAANGSLVVQGMAQSTTSVSGSGHMEIHALLDTSSSMGVGASQSDIDKLKAAYNCAFSCHGEKPNSSVKLRIDVMRDAVLDMIQSAKAEQEKNTSSDPARIKIALNKFDHNPTKITELSTDYSSLANEVTDIKLPNYHAGTDIKKALEWLSPVVKPSGDGLSAEKPRRFVFIVTDGLQDRYPAWQPINFPGPYGANDRTGAMDPAACAALKAKDVTVAVLYTTHIGISGYEWYWQIPRPHVRPALEKCASPNFFFEASNAAELSKEFKKMFQKALKASTARLEK